MCTDPFIEDPSFESQEKVLSESDVLVIAAPHRAYRELNLEGREVVDIWGLTGPIRL
jgi:UDP-N-acetyl-D-mannosaminuronic acid dehydrogenase